MRTISDKDIAQILKPFRTEIDALDQEIVTLLVKRFDVIDRVAHIKAEHRIPAILEDRVREVIDNAARHAANLSSPDVDFIREIYTLLVTISCNKEDEFLSMQTKQKIQNQR